MLFRSEDDEKAKKASEKILEIIKKLVKNGVNFPLRVLGPVKCSYGKINGKFRYRLILKCKNTYDFRNFIRDILSETGPAKEFNNVNVFADINGLELNAKTQKPVATINNLMLILSNDTRLKDGIGGLNEFVQRHEKKGSLPWWTYNKANPYWTDADDSGLRAYIENGYEIYNISKLTDALNVLVQRESFHPLRAYLDGLEWDGIKRADTLLIDYMGADDDLYTRTFKIGRASCRERV